MSGASVSASALIRFKPRVARMVWVLSLLLLASLTTWWLRIGDPTTDDGFARIHRGDSIREVQKRLGRPPSSRRTYYGGLGAGGMREFPVEDGRGESIPDWVRRFSYSQWDITGLETITSYGVWFDANGHVVHTKRSMGNRGGWPKWLRLKWTALGRLFSA